tara:strand:- start:6154 stop:7950 length:1797 start_codon:yes stop_codon:yes gene_type:complete
MSALSKLFVKTISRVIKNTTKFEISVDELIEKFKDTCPPKDQLLQIVKEKNQIQTALNTVVSAFTKLQTTVDITTVIVTTVTIASKVLTVVPAPPFFPSGVLAEGLDILGNLLKSAKGSLKIVPGAAKTITKAAQSVLDKLALLDGVLNKCLEELLNNENMAWDSEKEYGAGEVVTFGNNSAAGDGFCSLGPQYTTQAACEAAGGTWNAFGNGNGSGDGSGGGISYYKSLGDGNLNNAPLPAQVPPLWTGSDITEARSNLALEIGNVASGTGINVDVNLNQNEEQLLLDQLGANSNDPYLYQKTGFNSADWRFIIETNNNNDFEFPQRRIRAENINQSDSNPFKNIVVYNIFGKKYSYSLSVEVLVNEVIFIIENLNVTWYQNNNISGSQSASLDPTVDDTYSFDYVNVAGSGVSDPNSLLTSSIPTSSTNVNFIPIKFNDEVIDFQNSFTNAFGSDSSTFPISVPTSLNNPLINQINGLITTTQVSQSVIMVLETGFNNVGGGVGFGNFNNNLVPSIEVKFTPDVIKTWTPSLYPNLTAFTTGSTSETENQSGQSLIPFTYNAIGSYQFKLQVINQANINNSVGARVLLKLDYSGSI